MTFLLPYVAAITLAATPPSGCALPEKTATAPRVFTNADLELMSACRYQTGALSKSGAGPSEPSPKGRGGSRPSGLRSGPAADAAEADWRARWQAIDQKAKRLRREALDLRREAGEASRDPKRRPTGRRSPSLLLHRALRLELEAMELEDEFQERARREGALPGWLRSRP